MSKRYRSRYIVEVVAEKTYYELIDSSGERYYINKTDEFVVNEFRCWFRNIFIKGIPQYLTVLQYKQVEHDGQIDNIVEQFVNLHFEKSVNLKIS